MSVPQLGVFLPVNDEGAPPVIEAARHAENLGFESVWTTDQLVRGEGGPMVDSGIVLAAAAAVTTRIKLGYGVMILPLRPVAWAAKQVATLQLVSGDRILFGAGVGGDRHQSSWQAVGVPSRERGRRTNQAMDVLPDLIAGRPTRIPDQPDHPTIQLEPAATVPPFLVGGMSEAALVRTIEHDAGWFSLQVTAPVIAEYRARLATLAGQAGKPLPEITTVLMASLTDDPAAPSEAGLTALLTDPHGKYGMTPEIAATAVRRGSAAAIAAYLAELAEAGADRVTMEFVGGDWKRQAELLMKAV
jgi:alkanesulfonate monooxygenase SsuD/methylene tetrahydromethanopterin reductase-like flavin-dependent oxidoreductase (luciferase family)